MGQSVTLTVRPGKRGFPRDILRWKRHRHTDGVSTRQLEAYLGKAVPTRPYRVTYHLNPKGLRKVGWNLNVFCFWPKGWTKDTRYSRTVEVI